MNKERLIIKMEPNYTEGECTHFVSAIAQQETNKYLIENEPLNLLTLSFVTFLVTEFDYVIFEDVPDELVEMIVAIACNAQAEADNKNK